MNGPKLNNIPLHKSNRDPLGTESVTTNISADIQKVIISPTDQAIYWPYYNWIYYSFYEGRDKKDWTVDEFRKYLKKEEKVFVLGNYLNGFNQGLNGITEVSRMVTKDPDATSYNLDFEMLQSMQNFYYYTSGLGVLNLIKYDQTLDDNDKYRTGHCTDADGKGVLLGKVVNDRIINTEYYKKYRNTDINDIPVEVLKEYGKALTFDLRGCDEIKKMFCEILYESNSPRLITEYMELLHLEYGFNKINQWDCLHYFYDQKEIDKQISIPANLIDVAKKCEILAGRMIFRYGLEGIWAYVMNELEETPLNEEDWINKSISASIFDGYNINTLTITDFLDNCNINYKQREEMRRDINRKTDKAIVYGLQFMISTYLRLYKNNEYEKQYDLYEEGGSESLSLNYWFEFLEENKQLSIVEFLHKLIDIFMIRQHAKVAFRKLLPRSTDYNDPYNFHVTNGIFTFNQHAGTSPITLRPISAYEVGLTLGKVKEM